MPESRGVYQERGRADGGPVAFRRIEGTPGAGTTEVLRLFALYPHHDALLKALGITREDKAACQYTALGREDGEVFLAEQDGRLEAILQLVPQTWASSLLGGHLMTRAPEADRTLQSVLLRAGLYVAGREALSVARPRPVHRPEGHRFRLEILPPEQLARARELARNEALYSPLAANPRFSLQQLQSFYADLPAFYHQVPQRRIVAAQEARNRQDDQPDEILALLGCSLRTFIGKSSKKTTAEVDFLATRESVNQPDLERQLLGEALDWAHREGVQSVLVRTDLLPNREKPALQSLRYEGFDTVEFRRVFLYSDDDGRGCQAV